MTESKIENLIPLSKSWLNSASLITKYGCKKAFYNQAERAYELISSGGEMSFILKGSVQSPIVNPVFIIHEWQNDDIAIVLNGDKLIENQNYRQDFVQKIDRRDLIIWMDLRSDKEMSILFR
jgi:hypothetical protein